MDTQTTAARRLGTLGTTTMVLSLLAGYAGDAPERVDEAQVKQFAGRGYLSDDHFSIATTFSNWRVGEHVFALAWTAPVSGNALPVVVYLPGLDESRTAGERWRTAWAQAGYAVLSVQLLDEGPRARSSDEARHGDIGWLARVRYESAASTARLNALAALLAELNKGHSGEATLMRRLDLSHVAFAGYDVGAYTALLVAGESPSDDALAAPLPVSPSAFIALSPYAHFSGKAFGARRGTIDLPVLSVNGGAANDATGIVASAAVRNAPFEYMPSRDAYMLWLANAGHVLLSGSALAAEEEFRDAARGGQGYRAGRSPRRARRGASERFANPQDSGEQASFGARQPDGPRASPTDRALNVSLVQGVTTAFLDAYLKRDSIAQEWLRKDVRRWVGDRGEWKRK